jgi:hypothetical protein
MKNKECEKIFSLFALKEHKLQFRNMIFVHMQPLRRAVFHSSKEKGV